METIHPDRTYRVYHVTGTGTLGAVRSCTGRELFATVAELLDNDPGATQIRVEWIAHPNGNDRTVLAFR